MYTYFLCFLPILGKEYGDKRNLKDSLKLCLLLNSIKFYFSPVEINVFAKRWVASPILQVFFVPPYTQCQQLLPTFLSALFLRFLFVFEIGSLAM